MRSSAVLLLIGILLMATDFVFNMDCEDAKSKSYAIDATVTRIECREKNRRKQANNA